jgi:hypothetical protein
MLLLLFRGTRKNPSTGDLPDHSFGVTSFSTISFYCFLVFFYYLAVFSIILPLSMLTMSPMHSVLSGVHPGPATAGRTRDAQVRNVPQ